MVWTNFEECREQIVGVLRHSMEYQSPIVVAYASGSRAGQERTLTVVAIQLDHDWPPFDAKEVNGEIRSYAPTRILWIIGSDGIRHENKERIKIRSQYQAACAMEQDELSRVFLGTCNPGNQTALRVEDKPCADNFLESVVLISEQSRSVNVMFRKDATREKVVPALKYLIGRSEGRAWNVAGCLLEAGFWAPAWAKYAQTLRLEGNVLRGATLRLRDSNLQCDDRGNIPYQERWRQCDIYNSSRLRPPSEDEDSLIDRVRLFEADIFLYPEDLMVFKGMPPVALGLYLTLSGGSSELEAFPSNEINATNLHLLIECGLLKKAAELPIQILIQKMRATELYAPIKARKVQLAKRGLRQYRDYFSANMDSEYETTLRASEWLSDKYMFVSPPHWSWEKLQDLRTIYVAMVKSVVLWLSGHPVGAGEGAYFLNG